MRRRRSQSLSDLMRNCSHLSSAIGIRHDDRASVKGVDRIGKLPAKPYVECCLVRLRAEEVGLIKAAHVQGPFDSLSRTANRQLSAWILRDGRHVQINLRCMRLVDGEFALDDGSALLQGREVHI